MVLNYRKEVISNKNYKMYFKNFSGMKKINFKKFIDI
jgi:hypothetical protein